MKDITIKIKGKQYIGHETEDYMEFITEGKFSQRGDSRYFIYDESELSGMEGCKTVLKLTDDSLSMRRVGKGEAYNSHYLFFSKGKRTKTIYNTPYGNVDMEIYTEAFHVNFDDEAGGEIKLDYRTIMADYAEGRNILDIKIDM